MGHDKSLRGSFFFSEIRIISLQERAFIKDLASVDK